MPLGLGLGLGLLGFRVVDARILEFFEFQKPLILFYLLMNNN